ncbi:MAG: hypothetical protein WB561_16250 [Terracidiphilus sp.]
MIERYIIHPLNHTILLVDISAIGLPSGVYPPEGDLKMVPSYRFQNLSSATEFLLKRGAGVDELEKASTTASKGAIFVLTIPEPLR